jgi:membrane-associated phospholipid phosphatase
MKLSIAAERCLGTTLVLALWATTVSAQSTSAPVPPALDANVAPCSQYGLSTVVRCIGHDMKGIVKRDSLRWLAIGGVLAGGSLLLDDEVLRAMAEPDKDQSTEFAEFLGEAGIQFGVPAAMYFIARGHEGTQDMAIMLIRTQTVNAILTRGLKMLPRPRPYQESATPTKGSFPSGHTSAVFATATVLQRKLGWKAGVPAYLVAGYIGTTRLQNVHYLSDVTFGAALGIASGLAVSLPGNRHSGLALAPIFSRGTVGLSVTIGGRAAE